MTALSLGPEDWLIVLGRALANVTLFVAFGTLLLRRAVVPAASPAEARWLAPLQGPVTAKLCDLAIWRFSCGGARPSAPARAK